MQKISLLAQSYQELTWRGSVYPPPLLIRLTFMKKPIQNRVNKHITHDLKVIVHWLWANRISLNDDKTEIILFRSENKKAEKKLNFRINGQKIIPTTHIK